MVISPDIVLMFVCKNAAAMRVQYTGRRCAFGKKQRISFVRGDVEQLHDKYAGRHSDMLC